MNKTRITNFRHERFDVYAEWLNRYNDSSLNLHISYPATHMRDDCTLYGDQHPKHFPATLWLVEEELHPTVELTTTMYGFSIKQEHYFVGYNHDDSENILSKHLKLTTKEAIGLYVQLHKIFGPKVKPNVQAV